MKFSLSLIALCFTAAVVAQVQGDFQGWLQNQTNWNDIETGLIASLPPISNSQTDLEKADTVRFFLYTDNSSSPDELVYNDTGSLTSSSFNENNPTRFFLHGFGQTYRCNYPQEIKNIYIANNRSLNIILVDWSLLAAYNVSLDSLTNAVNSSRILLDYYHAAKNTAIVGGRVGDMIEFLVEGGFTTLDRTDVVGFSLGAQAAGYAGRRIISTMDAKLPRITGIEPAGPLFLTGLIGQSLSSNDATFVTFIHTDMGQSGTLRSLGHATFFVNGGYPPQPGCNEPLAVSTTFVAYLPYALIGSCSHNTAPRYYAQSITSNIPTKQCAAAVTAVAYNSVGKRAGQLCSYPKSPVYFGERTASNARGYFYVALNLTGPAPADTC